MISNDNTDEKENVIAEINDLYAKYDALYLGVVTVNAERAISPRGQSIIVDVKYYLRHPNFYLQFESAAAHLLKEFSIVVL